ncbi:MAG: hypothetical protein LBS22_04450 [Puniceicoccales bacterium]|nr:hypothetical protein [Puniceicoccales bacterium]
MKAGAEANKIGEGGAESVGGKKDYKRYQSGQHSGHSFALPFPDGK